MSTSSLKYSLETVIYTSLASAATAMLITLSAVYALRPVTDASAHYALLQTPWLGASLWQGARRSPIRYIDKTAKDLKRLHIAMHSAPFEIRLPYHNPDVAIQICAWTDDAIFTPAYGYDIEQTCLADGMGIADTQYGSGQLHLADNGHNYFLGDRIHINADGEAVLRFSAVQHHLDATPLADWQADLYLLVFMDHNLDKQFQVEEFEFMVLNFEEEGGDQ